jgi:hypothetical protein
LLDVARPAHAVVHHTSGRWAPFKVQIEAIDREKDLVAFAIDSPDGEYQTGVPHATVLDHRARALAKRHDRPRKDVFELLAFSALCRQTPSIDYLVTADPLIGLEPLLLHPSRHPREGLALLGLA